MAHGLGGCTPSESRCSSVERRHLWGGISVVRALIPEMVQCLVKELEEEEMGSSAIRRVCVQRMEAMLEARRQKQVLVADTLGYTPGLQHFKLTQTGGNQKTTQWLAGQGQSMKTVEDALGQASGVSEHGTSMEPDLEGRVRVTPCLSHCSTAAKGPRPCPRQLYESKHLTEGARLRFQKAGSMAARRRERSW